MVGTNARQSSRIESTRTELGFDQFTKQRVLGWLRGLRVLRSHRNTRFGDHSPVAGAAAVVVVDLARDCRRRPIKLADNPAETAANQITVVGLAMVASMVLVVVVVRAWFGVAALVAVVALVAVMIYAYRVLRVEVVAHTNGLVVRNLLSSEHNDWSEVTGFSSGASRMAAGKGIMAVLGDGNTKPLEATYRRWWLGRGYLDSRDTARCE